MKLSISLPDGDVEFLDAYATASGFRSRSAVVHRALRLLQASQLGAAYEDAWAEWSSSEEPTWEGATADGLAE
jgi:Arc/MetJ-type ribon-helix-helix transcriptional regulator